MKNQEEKTERKRRIFEKSSLSIPTLVEVKNKHPTILTNC
jgi:hypothetical protein